MKIRYFQQKYILYIYKSDHTFKSYPEIKDLLVEKSKKKKKKERKKKTS